MVGPAGQCCYFSGLVSLPTRRTSHTCCTYVEHSWEQGPAYGGDSRSCCEFIGLSWLELSTDKRMTSHTFHTYLQTVALGGGAHGTGGGGR
jgi:hypothetical protein